MDILNLMMINCLSIRSAYFDVIENEEKGEASLLTAPSNTPFATRQSASSYVHSCGDHAPRHFLGAARLLVELLFSSVQPF